MFVSRRPDSPVPESSSLIPAAHSPVDRRILVGAQHVEIGYRRVAEHGRKVISRHEWATPPERHNMADPVTIAGNGDLRMG